MSIAPPIYVEAPSAPAHRFGLYSVATLNEPASSRWQLGIEWEPFRTAAARTAAHECLDDYSPGYPLVIDDGVGLVEVTPVVVYGSYGCQAASRPVAEAQDRARTHLTTGEERGVELAVWNGATGARPTFNAATDLTPAGGAVTPSDGLGILEEAIGRLASGLGVIHAPRLLAPHLSRDGIVSRQGQRLETMLGNYVALGAGYPVGEGPAAQVDGEVWMVATGIPQVWRGEMMVTPEEDLQVRRDDNEIEIIAQRTVAVGWSGPTVAVLVDAPEVE